MQLTIKLAPKQWVKAVWFLNRSVFRSQLLVFGAGIVVWVLFNLGIGVWELSITRAGGTPPSYINTFCTVVSTLIIVVSVLLSLQQGNEQLIRGSTDTTFGPIKYELRDSGIYMEGRGWNGFYYWSLFKEIAHRKGFVLLIIDIEHVFQFPEEQVGDVEAFKQFVSERMKASHSSA